VRTERHRDTAPGYGAVSERRGSERRGSGLTCNADEGRRALESCARIKIPCFRAAFRGMLTEIIAQDREEFSSPLDRDQLNGDPLLSTSSISRSSAMSPRSPVVPNTIHDGRA